MTVRAAGVTAGLLALVAAGGCGRSSMLDTAARANAACLSAVHDRLGLADGDAVTTDGDTHLTAHSSSWQVDGVALTNGGRTAFRCTVVRDPTEPIRGMRVDRVRLGG